METPAQVLSDFACSLRYRDIPVEARGAAVRALVDTIGVCLAAQDMAFAKLLTSLVTEWGGAPESTVIASGAKIPAVNAIIANGNTAHGIDFDNSHGEAMSHPGACIIPTALAVAEKVGAGGEELIAAMVAGLEVQTRIASVGVAKFHARGFHPTFISGCFGAAVTAAKLLGLSPEQLTNALGICGTQASGLFEYLEDGTWAKRFGPGWAGHGGTIAALMAGRGYTGPKTIFEGRFGLYRSHLGEGNYRIERLVRGLGTEWETAILINKRYPCCGVTHPFINAARTIRRTHDFGIADIQEVECRIQPVHAQIVCEPQANKQGPDNSYQAKFSLYYTVACALLHDRVTIDDFTDEAIKNPEVIRLAERVRYTLMMTEGDYQVGHPGTVIVRLRDGRELSKSYNDDFDNAMTDADVAEKFRENASRTLPSEGVERLLSALSEASACRNVGDLMRLTVP